MVVLGRAVLRTRVESKTLARVRSNSTVAILRSGSRQWVIRQRTEVPPAASLGLLAPAAAVALAPQASAVTAAASPGALIELAAAVAGPAAEIGAAIQAPATELYQAVEPFITQMADSVGPVVYEAATATAGGGTATAIAGLVGQEIAAAKSQCNEETHNLVVQMLDK